MPRTMTFRAILATVAGFCAIPVIAEASVFNMGPGLTSIEFVTIGHTGNPGDTVTTNQSTANPGSVSYEYRIAKYEVTNAQFATFLNSVAAADTQWPYLYDENMGSDPRGGITRSGSAGSYTYAVKSGMENKPVNYVDVYAAMRFVNWLNNGEGSGSTETGAYALNNASNFTGSRDPGATYFLPSEDEWHKAAHYQPASAGGDLDHYWAYPTMSNSAPTAATADANGDISNAGPFIANYNKGADWNSLDGNVTTVGTAGNATYFGVYDMAGNVAEWTDTKQGTSNRLIRGGSYSDGHFFIKSDYAQSLGGGSASANNGFRIAAVVPEPSSLALLGLAALPMLRRRRG